MARVIRDARSGRFVQVGGGRGVVETRELPGKIVVRTLRRDVYQDALKAAESTLRTQRLKSSHKKS